MRVGLGTLDGSDEVRARVVAGAWRSTPITGTSTACALGLISGTW